MEQLFLFQKRGHMSSIIKFTKVITLVVLIGIAANFAINNQDPIAVDLGPFAKTINIKLNIYSFLIFIFGVLTASFYFMVDSLKKAFIVKKQARAIKKLEKSTINHDANVTSPTSKVTTKVDIKENDLTEPSVDISPES